MTDIEIRTNIMNALIECRKEKALTQEQVASAFEVKPTTVASYQGFTSHYKTLMTRSHDTSCQNIQTIKKTAQLIPN